MKNNTKFILFILLITGIAFAIEYSLPRKFTWYPTFKSQDKEPFGCYVFDDVLSSSLKNGYSVEKKTFLSFQNDTTEKKHSFLSLNRYQSLTKIEMDVIVDLVERGNKVMLVSSSFSYNLTRKLGIEIESDYFSIYYFKRYVSENNTQDSLIVTDTDFNNRIYEFYPQIRGGYMKRSGNQYRKAIPDLPDSITQKIIGEEEEINQPTWADSLNIRVLAENTQKYPVALGITIGEGELFVLTTPLIFTNYGMLDRENAGYIFSLLSYIDDYPIIRLETPEAGGSMENESPLRYFLSHPPLRWSIYFLLISIVLFMSFAAKRRQRIIPVIAPPANKTTEFTELIGTLYYQRKNYADLVHKKYIYFADTLKRNTYIDIEAEELTMELCSRLSNKIGMQTERLYYLLERLQAIKETSELDEEQMKEYIKQMNEILEKSR